MEILSYVDTHCHLDEVITRLKAGSFNALKTKYIEAVTKPGGFAKSNLNPIFESCIAQFCDPAAYSPSLRMWPDLLEHSEVFAAFGLHPHSAKYYVDSLEERILEAAAHSKCVAIGECGLDYHHNQSPRDVQIRVFRRQVELALALNKPIVIHSRNAEEDTLTVLCECIPRECSSHPIHMHCYSGSKVFTEELLRLYPGMQNTAILYYYSHSTTLNHAEYGTVLSSMLQV